MARSAEDVLAEFAEPPPLKANPPPGDQLEPPPNLDAMILTALSPVPVPEDLLSDTLDVPASLIARHLTCLEIDGRLQRHSGGLVSLPSVEQPASVQSAASTPANFPVENLIGGL